MNHHYQVTNPSFKPGFSVYNNTDGPLTDQLSTQQEALAAAERILIANPQFRSLHIMRTEIIATVHQK